MNRKAMSKSGGNKATVNMGTASSAATKDAQATAVKEESGASQDVPNVEVGVEVKVEESKLITSPLWSFKNAEPAPAEEPWKYPDQPFRLMDLPPEIRIMIFKELLVMSGPIQFYKRVWFFGAEPVKTIPFVNIGSLTNDSRYLGNYYENAKESDIIRQCELLSLFLTSKTLYRETVPLYFGSNTFRFDSVDDFEKFFQKLGPECRWQLARLEVKFDGRAPARAAKHMIECVGLRELTLKICSWSMASYSKVAPFEPLLIGMKDILRIRGLLKLDIVHPDPIYCHGRYPGAYRQTEATVEAMAAFKERLEVLKQPQDPKMLKRQERKDFPVRAKRTILGGANVITRGEKRMLEAQEGSSSR